MAEWLTTQQKIERGTGATIGHDESILTSSTCALEGASALELSTASHKGSKMDIAGLTACAFCKVISESIYICGKCSSTAYCSSKCYRSDWLRHKFSCKLGRPIDATAYLMFACYTDLSIDDDVAEKYGLLYFASAHDWCRLLNLYRRLVVEWALDEDELRSAIECNSLKEMLVFRWSQTKDLRMLSDMLWIKSKEGFEAGAKGPGIITLIEAAQKELLSPEELYVPFMELQPEEKRKALLFYAQIRNGYIPDVDEDNWVSLGFCTAADTKSAQRLAFAYGSLVNRCTFTDFWTAMLESNIGPLFSKYGLAERVSHMRNFRELMAIVKNRHQSVWELKRFILSNEANPFSSRRGRLRIYKLRRCTPKGSASTSVPGIFLTRRR